MDDDSPSERLTDPHVQYRQQYHGYKPAGFLAATINFTAGGATGTAITTAVSAVCTEVAAALTCTASMFCILTSY